MQVANALNNNIRILFNPKVEPFKLFDFLMVKSDEDRYLAQIIEIYDDKFDSSQNVAKLKLFYKIAPNNEVMPYDNFTPNKECEIIKIKQEEVENFINNGKRTFIFGTNTKSSTSLNVQFDFFNNNPIILADKVDNSNAISLNLAKNLSVQKHTIIIDSTGVVEFDDAQKIKASKNFRLPLNYSTIDFVFDKCLSDASLEFQQIAGSILLEIKKFAKRQALGFIPFNSFARVLLEQYKATPYPELKLLLVRLKKCQMDEIFAKTKKDVEMLFKTIEKNPITIIDISNVSSLWQKAYLEYFVSAIEQNVYLITRINDENCDVDLINKIYTEKKNIKFIPNVSYNYKKLPSLMQHCKNYILLPSLYQRADFLNANFALANLISDECIIFGENTDNFLYLAKDYTLETQEKRKNYRKIALSMANADSQSQQEQINHDNGFENKSDSQRLIDELTQLEENQIKSKETQDLIFNDDYKTENENNSEKESFEEIENPKNIQDEFVKSEDIEEHDDFSVSEETKEENEPQEDEFEPLEIIKNDTSEDTTKEEIKEEIKKDILNITEEETKEEENSQKIEDLISDLAQEEENKEDTLEIIDIKENPTPKKEDFGEETKEETLTREEKDAILKEKFNIQDAQLIDPDETDFSNVATVKIADDNQEENNELDFSDEELDFFQIAKESSMQYEQEELKKEKVVVDDVEYKTQDDTQDNKKKDEINNLATLQANDKKNDIDLNEIANNSIDASFNEIIDKKPQELSQGVKVDEEVNINIDSTPPIEKENLPIFKEEQNNTSSETYKTGDVVVHKKYGKGTVAKTIKYEERQLLQIEFEESGKKLLDPKVADIKLEQ